MNNANSFRAFVLASASFIALAPATADAQATATTIPTEPSPSQPSTSQTASVPSENSGNRVGDIVVTGIRSSLKSAAELKRAASNLIEVIKAEDIGKLPDKNLAEVLENITGVQIDRTAGVGSAVQIRGTSANRVEINGVSTVSSGSDRTGIAFSDLPAALISSVEVVKVPTASTTEGSVGGTINLKTIRALDLREPLFALRGELERSSLAKANNLRFSGTLGNRWNTSIGEIGVVVSGSYAQTNVASVNPRVDRDRDVLPNSGRTSAQSFPFLRIQFLDQYFERYDYDTKNLTGSLQWKPSDTLKFYFDATLNRQNQRQESSRVTFSGTGSNAVVDNTVNDSFDTIDLGSIEGPNGSTRLGSVRVALTGTLGVGVLSSGTIDPNLRTNTIASGRKTDSNVFALGGDWTVDRLKIHAEGSYSDSVAGFPNVQVVTDFINPRGPQPSIGRSVDNGVPAIWDLRNGILQFGIAPGTSTTPTSAELLNPANYALNSFSQSLNTNKNKDTAFRLDLSYDSQDVIPFFASVDAGYRRNVNSAETNSATAASSFTDVNTRFFRPRGDFGGVLVAGPNNFNFADNRQLYVADYLLIDPTKALSDTQSIISALNASITRSNAANGVNYPLLTAPTDSLSAFFSVSEATNALYLQGNYRGEILGISVRGNVGVRWLRSSITSRGNNILNGVVTPTEQKASYSVWLPRWNFVASPTDELNIRAGISRDIRRPDFRDLSTSIAFSLNPQSAVSVGNPALLPEGVWSYDLSAEYYPAPNLYLSVGAFHKSRTNLISDRTINPAEPRGTGGQINRDITAPCEEGGIFNPIADRGVFSSQTGTGICVPLASKFNIDGVATQSGIEAAFQFDLSPWEDKLGWASGFGFAGNVTFQKQGGNSTAFRTANGSGNALNNVLGRTDATGATATTEDDVVRQVIRLTNLSNRSYNLTFFYDKYGLNFRARYTWRSSYFTSDLTRFNLPLVAGARGQLNASLSYALNDHISFDFEGVNLTRQDRPLYCVNAGTLLCEQGIADRRLTGGVNIKF
jgi:iron complex outermembrane recepter protein